MKAYPKLEDGIDGDFAVRKPDGSVTFYPSGQQALEALAKAAVEDIDDGDEDTRL